MGLLTDPSAGQGKLTKALLKYYKKLCVLLYIVGIGWFCSLAHNQTNLATYFSENALLPGLVKSEFKEENAARVFYEELLDEMKKYEDGMPYPWILAKMKQIGLSTYTHNFTLNYPLGRPQTFTGKNVYGILRAARASSTESLVLSVPYRTPKSVHTTTAPSIAIMLAFAKFANREKYWAKDIIFLITEHEQLGIQAWLEAYHGVGCGSDHTLNHGDLKGRGGSIQAAINLEFHDMNIGQVDIKIEGLNGQLPNLDLFNLASKMLAKEGISHSFKSRPNKSYKDPVKTWFYGFHTLMAMVATQATGIPNGNHGLFHRFGIEALTLEGFGDRGYNKAGFLVTGRVIELIFRSLNNLLERFHQSFFFYLLPSSERFISIGLYIPVVCLIAGALYIKACANWCQLKEDSIQTSKSRKKAPKQMATKKEKAKQEPKNSADYWRTMGEKYEEELKRSTPPPHSEPSGGASFVSVLFVFFATHVIGVLIMNSPQLVTGIGARYGYSTDFSLFVTFAVVSGLLLFFPCTVSIRKCDKSMTLLNILALLELGTALICISMNNFSLGLFCSVLFTPLALVIGVSKSSCSKALRSAVWLLAHPLLAICGVVFIYTLVMFPGDGLDENFNRVKAAIQQTLVYSVVDSMIYGNWLFSVVTSIFLPNWLCFWIVAFSESTQQAREDGTPKNKKID